MIEEPVQNDRECEERDRVADQNLRPKCPVKEGDVAWMPRPSIDSSSDEGMGRRFLIHYQVREVGGSSSHSQRAEVLCGQSDDKAWRTADRD